MFCWGDFFKKVSKNNKFVYFQLALTGNYDTSPEASLTFTCRSSYGLTPELYLQIISISLIDLTPLS